MLSIRGSCIPPVKEPRSRSQINGFGVRGGGLGVLKCNCKAVNRFDLPPCPHRSLA